MASRAIGDVSRSVRRAKSADVIAWVVVGDVLQRAGEAGDEIVLAKDHAAIIPIRSNMQA